jgi:hypothetical protein
MPTNTLSQTSSFGVRNRTIGTLSTTSAAAAAATFTVGFQPRVVRFHNLTDRISEEWFEGIDESGLFAALNGILAKLDADAGVTATDYLATCGPAGATLAQLETSLELLTAKLDAGAGVTDTNFAALWNIPVGTSPTVALLKASVAGVAAKLDADAGVTDTDYAALWPVAAFSLHTVAAGTRTFEKTNGVVVNADGSFTMNATALVASKSFCWEAIG